VTTANGEINAPERGSVTPAGSRTNWPVTTANGSTGRASGGGERGAMVNGILAGAWVIAVPLIKQWFAKNYLERNGRGKRRTWS
jgi:hypothetical protein